MNGWTPGTYDLAKRFLNAPGNELALGTETVQASGELRALTEAGFFAAR